MLLPIRPRSMGGNDQYTKILLHFDGANGSTTITDYCAGATPHTWTNHTGSISTTASKFGGSSYDCGAGTGWVDTPDSSDFTLGSGDFTADVWFNRQGGDGTFRSIFNTYDGSSASSRSLDMGISSGNQVFFGVTNGTSTTFVTGTTLFTSTGWHHAAAVRTGNTLKLFLDGVQEGGDVSFTLSVNDSTAPYTIGRYGGANGFNGYIDEFRLSVGKARWTSNFPISNSCHG